MRLLTTVLLSLCCALSLAAQPSKRGASPATTITTTLSLSVTDGKGVPLRGVIVAASGPLTREAETDANGTLRLQGLTSGTYRFRFARKGFITLERDVVIPPRQPAMDQHVMLSAAPEEAVPRPPAPAPTPAPEPAKGATLPPPGKAVALSLPDFIERNFIAGTQPQKVSPVGCSGLAQTVLWQIREPWENRQHPDADAMLYVIGGDGSLRLEGRDITLQAGSFAVVPRGTSYALTRRGRNPLIVLGTLAGAPCSP